MNGYLLDTSVIARLHKPPVAERLAALGGADLRICVPVLLEIGVGARNAEHHRELLDDLRTAYPLLTASPWAQERAAEVQELLAASGAHRSARLRDLLVAATVEQAGLTVLHYDGDFEQVTRATGQPTEWVVPPGQADLPGPGQADYERWAAFVDGPTRPRWPRVRGSARQGVADPFLACFFDHAANPSAHISSRPGLPACMKYGLMFGECSARRRLPEPAHRRRETDRSAGRPRWRRCRGARRGIRSS